VILQKIYNQALVRPNHTAIISNGEPISYLVFAKSIEVFRKSWADLNLPKGTIAIIHVKNKSISWVATLALQSLGLVTVSGTSLNLLKDIEINNISCIFSDALVSRIDDYFPGIKLLKIPLDFAKKAEYVILPTNLVFEKTGGHILYTSGTTGRYKKIFNEIMLDLERVANRASIENVTSDFIVNILNVGPWTGIGYRRPLLAWYSGGTIVFDSRADAFKYLGQNKETHVMCTPGYIENAIKTINLNSSFPLWNFKLIIAGGLISSTLAELILSKITPNLSVTYACTELTTSVMSFSVGRNGIDYWFRPAKDREIEVVDSNEISLTNSEGFLRVKLNSLDHYAYLENEESTNLVFRDGWFYPGDLAIKNSNGQIRVLGRVNDVINIFGNKKASGPLEDALRDALDVSNVCVFSGLVLNDPTLIFFVVECGDKVIDENLLNQAGAEVSSKIGRCVFFMIKQLPRVKSGMLKIDRLSLRRMIINHYNKEQMIK
jgi:acyl-coenzyme A synthetase/AMP-(fatty) acid ligase